MFSLKDMMMVRTHSEPIESPKPMKSEICVIHSFDVCSVAGVFLYVAGVSCQCQSVLPIPTRNFARVHFYLGVQEADVAIWHFLLAETEEHLQALMCTVHLAAKNCMFYSIYTQFAHVIMINIYIYVL